GPRPPRRAQGRPGPPPSPRRRWWIASFLRGAPPRPLGRLERALVRGVQLAHDPHDELPVELRRRGEDRVAGELPEVLGDPALPLLRLRQRQGPVRVLAQRPALGL